MNLVGVQPYIACRSSFEVVQNLLQVILETEEVSWLCFLTLLPTDQKLHFSHQLRSPHILKIGQKYELPQNEKVLKTFFQKEFSDSNLDVIRCDIGGSVFGYLITSSPVSRFFVKSQMEYAGLVLSRIRERQFFEAKCPIDTVTELWTKNFFLDRLEAELSRARRYSHKISLAKIFFFREATFELENDLVMGATYLRKNLRSYDWVARWSVREFIVGLPESDGLSAAIPLERFRRRFLNNVAIGISEFPKQAADSEELISRASLALDQAMANRTTCVYRMLEL